METDAVIRELYAYAVKCGIFTAYHVVAVFRLGYVPVSYTHLRQGDGEVLLLRHPAGAETGIEDVA